eukprot:389028_1
MALNMEKSDAVLHYYASSIGSIICLMAILLTLIHTIYHYNRTFNHSQSRKHNRTDYILFFMLCFFALIPCTQYAFIRSNLITKQSPESFTKFQCAFGFWSIWTAFSMVNALVYAIFVWRVQTALKDSFFKYPTKLYISLHIFLITVTLILLILVWIPYPYTTYILYYFDSIHHVYCGSLTNPEHNDDSLNRIYFAGHFVFVFSNVLLDIILCYMFTTRLYAIKLKLVTRHTSESRMQSVSSTPRTNVEMTNGNDNTGGTINRTITLQELENEAAQSRSAGRILTLHHLIKKHTILVWIIVIANLMYIMCLIFGGSWFVTQMVWVLSVHITCTWLMFGSASKYWRFLTGYCCCYLCYCYNKRDVNAKTCFGFC